MIQITEDILKEMTDIIVKEVNPHSVILFGSHARGEAGPDSDIDFLVIEDAPFGKERSRRAEMVKLWQLLGNFPIAKDFLIFTAEEVTKWKTARNHVIAHAMKEGKVLYERH